MKESKNFIENIIDEDLALGLDKSLLKFRFPPEPNGFLHIGHVKAICVNFSLAKKYNAPVVLRFDDTNPEKEEQQYIDAIKKDISWLGFKWDEERFASDYFEQLYLWAIELIKNGKRMLTPSLPQQWPNKRAPPQTQAKTVRLETGLLMKI